MRIFGKIIKLEIFVCEVLLMDVCCFDGETWVECFGNFCLFEMFDAYSNGKLGVGVVFVSMDAWGFKNLFLKTD